LAADRSVDFLPLTVCVNFGWHTTNSTLLSHFLTNWITWSLGASLTSSPFTDNIWSPGSNCKLLCNIKILFDL
jgi:hypothetical protein